MYCPKITTTTTDFARRRCFWPIAHNLSLQKMGVVQKPLAHILQEEYVVNCFWHDVIIDGVILSMCQAQQNFFRPEKKCVHHFDL